MSRTRFSQAQNSTINGPRPSPLRVSKESIPIRKASSSSLAVAAAASSMMLDQQEKIIPRKNNPVIIYTQSPKIIHTQARDFMALVQKLTGLSRSENDPNIVIENNNGSSPRKIDHHEAKDEEVAVIGNNGHNGDTDHQHNQMSRVFSDSSNFNHPYLADFPLFTPTSANLFPSPNPVERYPSSLHVSPSMGNPISPSFFEFIKGLPEY